MKDVWQDGGRPSNSNGAAEENGFMGATGTMCVFVLLTRLQTLITKGVTSSSRLG